VDLHFIFDGRGLRSGAAIAATAGGAGKSFKQPLLKDFRFDQSVWPASAAVSMISPRWTAIVHYLCRFATGGIGNRKQRYDLGTDFDSIRLLDRRHRYQSVQSDIVWVAPASEQQTRVRRSAMAFTNRPMAARLLKTWGLKIRKASVA